MAEPLTPAVAEPLTPALVCARCNHPVAIVGEMLCERVQVMDSAVYSYELEVLDHEEVWCYSATNPENIRFDVCRFAQPRPRVVITGTPTREHSWFPPYLWRGALCPGCDSHLGWAFVEAASSTQPSFVGLILTRLRERQLPAAQIEAALNEPVRDRLRGARSALSSALFGAMRRLVGGRGAGADEGELDVDAMEARLQELVEEDSRYGGSGLEGELRAVVAQLRQTLAQEDGSSHPDQTDTPRPEPDAPNRAPAVDDAVGTAPSSAASQAVNEAAEPEAEGRQAAGDTEAGAASALGAATHQTDDARRGSTA